MAAGPTHGFCSSPGHAPFLLPHLHSAWASHGILLYGCHCEDMSNGPDLISQAAEARIRRASSTLRALLQLISS